jgi:glycosyltransferase involved in cell wall biosynthesis
MDLVHLPSLPTKSLDTLSHLLLSVAHLVMSRGPRIAILNDVGTSVAAPLLKLFGVRTVWWVDGPAWRRRKWGRVARALLRLSARIGTRWSDVIICDSRRAGSFYEEELGRAPVYVPYGATLRPAREEPGESVFSELEIDPGTYVLFVGRLTPEKGVEYLVRAFERLDTAQRLVIVGDDPYNRDYVTRLRATSDSRIVFAGYRYGSEFFDLLENALVYVQPSEVEGTSPVLLSAMAYGLPIIASDIDENVETVGDSGLLFRSRSVDALVEALRRMLVDGRLRTELGAEASRRVAEHYDWERVSDDFLRACGLPDPN